MSDQPPPKPGNDAFHRERSRCVDAFAACEEAVAIIMNGMSAKVAPGQFAQKIASLAKTTAGPHYAKARKAKVDELLTMLSELLPVRADIVHGRLKLAQINDDVLACLVNARELSGSYPVARLLTFEPPVIDKVRRKDRRGSSRRLIPVSLAFWKPRPSRAAAGGP